MSIFDKLKAWFGAKPPANDVVAPEEASEQDEEEPNVAPAKRTRRAPEEKAGARDKRRVSARDDCNLENEARALFDADKAADAIALLSERGIMFARHDTTALPCLCRRCLRPEMNAAECGVSYVRDFVVTRHRVFFYWMPAELAEDAKQMRASMRAEVRQRLRHLGSKQQREAINPFTKERYEIAPKEQRRQPGIDPFTGKVIR